MRTTLDDPSSTGRKSSTLGGTPSAAGNAQTLSCAYLKLRQLAHSVAHCYDVELKEAGLRTTQYILLSEIIKLQPVGPGALARAMNLDPSTLSRNLRPLKVAGWVEFAIDLDCRSKSVRITDSGRAKHIEGHQRWRIAQNKVNELLGMDRMAGLHALVDEFLGILAPRK